MHMLVDIYMAHGADCCKCDNCIAISMRAINESCRNFCVK